MADSFALTLDELPSREELEHTRQVLGDKLAEAGSELARTDWGLFDDVILDKLREALRGLDLVAVLGQAWAAAKELRELGGETALDGSARKLKLGQHPLRIDLHPVISVKCGELELPELRFTLRLEGEIAWAVLVVSAGVLQSLEKASLSINTTLLYGAQVIKGPLAKEWQLLAPHPFPNGGYRLADAPAPPPLA